MSPTEPSPPAERRLDPALLRSWPLPDDADGDKLARGTVLVIGGSEQTPGAVVLAGLAALRVGAGRLQLATAAAVVSSIAIAVPEALVAPVTGPSAKPLDELVARADAVVLGPGLLDEGQTADLLGLVLDHIGADVPLVVDARGLQALAGERDRAVDHRQLLLTPNREELAALMDGGEASEAAAARAYRATVLSFGRVAAPDGRLWIDPVPVRGLGTSGAGDVLAGAAGGLAARCGDGAHAGCWASLAHRTAASRLAARIAPLGYLARELADELPGAIVEITTG